MTTITLLRSASIALSGLALTACGAAGDAQWTPLADGGAACGLEMQDPLAWGRAVAASGLQVQEATAEPGLVMRVWSEANAGVTGTADTLSARARGPAWIAADVRPAGWMLYLPEGEAALRVTEAGAECALVAAE